MGDRSELGPGRSVERIAVLLDEISRSGSVGVRELARRLGWSKSIVHRLLSSLAHVGYVRQDPATAKYHLTVRLFELGSRALHHYGVQAETRRVASEIAGDTGETVLLAVLDGGDVVYVERVSQPQVIQIGHEVGRRSPASATSAGKALLADLAPEALRRLLGPEPFQAFTPQTITTYAALDAELAAVRRQGYATDREERYPDVRAAAAAIRDYTGRAIMALVVIAPSLRLAAGRLPDLGAYVRDRALETSRLLGYAPAAAVEGRR